MKKMLVLFASLLFILTLALPIAAEQYRYIIDEAGVLTDAEEKALNDKLTAFREDNSFDLVIITTNGVSSSDRMAFADDYYDYHDYGYGKKKSGALLLVNIDEDFTYYRNNSWISTSGKGIDYLTDDDISDIGAELTPMLLSGKYAEAFDRFADLTAAEISSYRSTDKAITVVVILITCLIGAFCYTGRLKKQLKSVADANEADNYVVDNSLNITRSYDRYLYSHVTKTRRESSSSGGSSTHTSSSGSSHGGGGF